MSRGRKISKERKREREKDRRKRRRDAQKIRPETHRHGAYRNVKTQLEINIYIISISIHKNPNDPNRPTRETCRETWSNRKKRQKDGNSEWA